MAQWVKPSAFGSGHDPRVWDRAPHQALCSAGSLLPSLSQPASLPTCAFSLCQIINTIFKKSSIYFEGKSEREKARAWVGERGRGTGRSRLPAEQGAQHGA